MRRFLTLVFAAFMLAGARQWPWPSNPRHSNSRKPKNRSSTSRRRERSITPPLAGIYSRDSRPATSASCHCRPDGRPNLRQLCDDDILDVSAAGIRQPRKRSAPDEIGKGRKNICKTDTAVETFLQVPEILFQPEIYRNDLEAGVEWYRVLANWGAFPPDPLRRACRPPHPPC